LAKDKKGKKTMYIHRARTSCSFFSCEISRELRSDVHLFRLIDSYKYERIENEKKNAKANSTGMITEYLRVRSFGGPYTTEPFRSRVDFLLVVERCSAKRFWSVSPRRSDRCPLFVPCREQYDLNSCGGRVDDDGDETT